MSNITSAMSRLKLGVYVVTASHEGQNNGMTAAWVTQASISPPMVVVSIAPSRYTMELIRGAGAFGLSVLPEGERGIELGRLFGRSSGRDHDKLAEVGWTYATKQGTPRLKEATAWMDCKLVNEFVAGDHILVVGELVASGCESEKETLTYRTTDYWG